MSKTAIFYAFHANKTAKVAEKIIEAFGKEKLEIVNAEEVSEETFLAYDNYIIGVATWWDGELPNYWDEFVPAIDEMDLKGKKFAIFGLGDQECYGENFNDGVGLFAALVEERGATVVAYTSAEDYDFEHSEALHGENQFCGLCLDQENQPDKSGKRIEDWIRVLRTEF
ncbi:MAG: flavodoxin [Mangrovibacterium sp.]